jgi:Rieske Fe-S protein
MEKTTPTRRKFIKDACGFCLTGAGLLLLAGELESCKTPAASTSATPSKVSFPKSSFGAGNSFVLDNKQLPNKVLVVKSPDGGYKAVSLKCTHLGIGLKEDGAGGLKCPAHGSKFDLTGKVTHGPAKNNLQVWNVIEEGDNLVIQS